MLNRDLTDITYVTSVPCTVASGTLAHPYTTTTIAFLRGVGTSDAVQIDHVVALSDAWQKGAQQLTYSQRVARANDPLNLQSTDGPTNEQKGDGDAATWLPPNTAFRCAYVARRVSVKATYSLWVTQAEHDAIAGILAQCPGQLAPTDQPDPAAPPAPRPGARAPDRHPGRVLQHSRRPGRELHGSSRHVQDLGHGHAAALGDSRLRIPPICLRKQRRARSKTGPSSALPYAWTASLAPLGAVVSAAVRLRPLDSRVSSVATMLTAQIAAVKSATMP